MTDNQKRQEGAFKENIFKSTQQNLWEMSSGVIRHSRVNIDNELYYVLKKKGRIWNVF